MTPTTLISASGGLVATLGLGLAGWMPSQAGDDLAATQKAQQELTQLGAPQPALVARFEEAAKAQAVALEEAAQVVPPLPEAYRATDLASAAKRVRDDLEAVRLRADRLGVALPKPLPLEAGLDSDGSVRAVQLAFLHLVRSALDRALDAGVSRITRIETVRAWTDPSGSFAAFAVDLEVEAGGAAVQALLADLGRQTGSGITAQRVAIEAGRTEGALRLSLGLELLTINIPEWKLLPDLPAKGPASARPTKGLGARP